MGVSWSIARSPGTQSKGSLQRQGTGSSEDWALDAGAFEIPDTLDKTTLRHNRRWTIETLRDAIAKVIAVGLKRTPPEHVLSLRLSRGEYWACFSDFSITFSDGCLTVNLEDFTKLAESSIAPEPVSEPEETSVPAISVICGILVFCKGNLEDKASVLYDLFDVGSTRNISMVSVFLSALVTHSLG